MSVKRIALLFVLYTFALASCVVLVRVTFAVDSGVIRVPQDYPTIQEAVDAANPGETILVSAGTYNEYVHVNKSLNIIGESATNTSTYAFEVHANHVTISGFKITTVYPGYGVYLFNSHWCNISYNIVRDGLTSIVLYNSSNNLIGHNDIFDYSSNGWGICLLFNSDNNTIRGNEMTTPFGGFGIGVHFCFNNKVEHNRLKTPGGYGILIDQGSDNVVDSNIAESNEYGIVLWYGRRNRVYHNNFINSPCDVVEADENFWDNGAEGNYWSDYNGTDLDGDGIGDTYLPWQGVDYHPLMVPWGPLKTFFVDVNGTTHTVMILSNSTIASFDFNQSLKHVSFNSTGPPGEVGFCNVTIPKALLYGHLLVSVDDRLTDFSLSENETHSCLYFTYTYSTRNIRIVEYAPIPGDINYDGRVDLYDIVVVATAYGARPGDAEWNPDADIAPPWGKIDLYDAVTILYHYGKTYQS